MKPRVLEVRTKILKKNDVLARALRERFAAANLCVVNLVSGPGAGKTELLTATMRRLADRYAVAAVVGDLATDNDARRLAESGAPARQIQTDSLCHLEADMVEQAVEGWDLTRLDFLFIENVGNLVCPASWDLGEDRRVLLLSVTEGEDKPLKYPTLIHTADAVVLSKVDLSEAVGFNRPLAYEHIAAARPGIEVIETSVRTDQGIDSWIAWLRAQRRAELPPAMREAD